MLEPRNIRFCHSYWSNAMPSLSAKTLAVNTEAWGGFGTLSGLLILDGGQLTLEYQTADAILGLLRSDVKRIALPLAHLRAIETRAGFFWLMPKLELHFSQISHAIMMGGDTAGEICFSVRFSHRKQMRQFVDALRHARASFVHAQIEDELAGVVQAPPAPTQAAATEPLLEQANGVLAGIRKLAQSIRS